MGACRYAMVHACAHRRTSPVLDSGTLWPAQDCLMLTDSSDWSSSSCFLLPCVLLLVNYPITDLTCSWIPLVSLMAFDPSLHTNLPLSPALCITLACLTTSLISYLLITGSLIFYYNL